MSLSGQQHLQHQELLTFIVDVRLFLDSESLNLWVKIWTKDVINLAPSAAIHSVSLLPIQLDPLNTEFRKMSFEVLVQFLVDKFNIAQITIIFSINLIPY